MFMQLILPLLILFIVAIHQFKDIRVSKPILVTTTHLNSYIKLMIGMSDVHACTSLAIHEFKDIRMSKLILANTMHNTNFICMYIAIISYLAITGLTF